MDPNFIMKMGTGAATARADVSNDLSTLYVFAFIDCPAHQVSITRENIVPVIDLDHASVARSQRRENYDAIGRSHNTRSHRTGNINAAMECAFPVEWIDALPEIASDRTFHRPERRSRSHALPIGQRCLFQAKSDSDVRDSRQRRAA